MIVATTLLNKLNRKQLVVVALVCGGIAIIESNILGSVLFLARPGVPFDADVSLLVLSYLMIGYILKDKIKNVFLRQSLKMDIIAVGVAVLLIIEHMLAELYGLPRQIDMKLGVYKNPISVYIISILYGVVIARLSAFIEQKFERLSKCLAYMGNITIPIMFLHEPLNRFCSQSSHLLFYLLVGIGISVLCSIVGSKFECCKYFGIPKRKVVASNIRSKNI